MGPKKKDEKVPKNPTRSNEETRVRSIEQMGSESTKRENAREQSSKQVSVEEAKRTSHRAGTPPDQKKKKQHSSKHMGLAVVRESKPQSMTFFFLRRRRVGRTSSGGLAQPGLCPLVGTSPQTTRGLKTQTEHTKPHDVPKAKQKQQGSIKHMGLEAEEKVRGSKQESLTFQKQMRKQHERSKAEEKAKGNKPYSFNSERSDPKKPGSSEQLARGGHGSSKCNTRTSAARAQV